MKMTSTILAILAAGTGFAAAYDSVVTINEIHYNAPAGQSEWIELRNNQGVDVNLAGWKLTGGVDYTFPATGPGSTIPGGGYLVIAATPAMVAGSIGPFTGTLDNGGETIRLRNVNDRIMDEVSYDDEGDWPVGADGSGATLSRVTPGAETGASAWVASTQLGGTPGNTNFADNGQTLRSHITSGDTWKYRDAGTAPPPDWNTPAYDDSAWSSGAAALGAQTPSTTLTVTADLVERFRASDITGLANGATVATWNDTATGDGIAQNAAGANTPTFRTNATSNGKPAVRYTGTSESRTSLSPGIGATSGWTIFMVVKANAALTGGATSDGAGAYLLDRNITGFPSAPLASIKAVGGAYGFQKRNDLSAGLGGPVSTSSISTTSFQIVTIRRNRTLSQYEIWVDGTLQSTAGDDGSALTPSPFVIGHHATAGTAQGLNGDIAEILVYKSELANLDFQKAGAYLETEYGLNTAFQAIATPLSMTAPVSYLRKSFNFPGDPARTLLRLNHTVADGAVFYLNGTEVLRTNMPAGPAGHSTAASSIIALPSASGMVNLPPGALLSGTNVLSVSLHKGAGGTSSYFSAVLDSVELPPPSTTAPTLAFSEIAGAADATFFIELENRSGSPVNTTGWTVQASSGQSYALPAQSLAAGARVSIDAATLGFTPADGVRLYLIAPGGTMLRDAREVTNRLRGLVSGGRWGHPTSATPGGSNIAVIQEDIVINEIFYKGLDGSPEQWIELHNKGTTTVDTSGWKFSDGIGFDFPATPATTIPAGGYLVVAWDPAAFASLHSGVPALGPWSGSLAGGGELITLRDANDNVADQVRYAGGGRWSEWAAGGGSSLELRNPSADNSAGESWDSSDESLTTPWQTVSYSGLGNHATTSSVAYYNELVLGLLDTGEVLVDDIVVSETLTGGGGTRAQLIQNGNFTGGTTDKWRNVGTHRFTTVVDDPYSPGNKVLKIVADGATEHMNNHCETTLKNGASYVTTSTTSTYTISFRAKWLRGSNRLHSRLYFNRLPKQTLLARPVTGGTPGAQNSRFVANTGPAFSGLSVVPAVPYAGQPATVSITAGDSDGLSNMELLTSLNGGAFSSTAMSLTDGKWSAQIPGQSFGASIQFYVRATDSLGAVTTFPAGGANSRAMIPWEDGRSQLALPSGARPHNIRIVMTAADANDMYLAENVQSNWYRPCTFIMDDEVAYYDAGCRLKSSEHGRFQQNRVGWNVKFGADNMLLGAHETISIDRSGNASNEGLDGTSVTSQREILLKQVMNAAGGIYSQEDDLIRMIPTVAAGSPAPAYNGSLALGEAILSKSRFDDEYLDGQWDNGGSGPLFKQEYIYPLSQTIDPVTRVVTTHATGGTLSAAAEGLKVPQTGGSPGPAGIAVQAYTPPATGNALYTIDPKENYRWHWLLRNSRTGDDYSGVIAAATAIGQATTGAPSAFTTQTEAALNVDAWLRASALPMMWMVTDNYLGNTGATHNFILYFPPGEKGVAIPWDCDYLGQTTAAATVNNLTGGGSIAKFVVNGANKRRYYCHVLDILNRSFNDAFLTQWATHYARFGADNVTSSLPVLRLRANYLRDIIMGTNVSGSNAGLTRVIPNAAFAITTPGPVNSATPFTPLTGTGWLDIDTIRLQGSPAPLAVTWTGETAWSLQLPVSAGTATYVLEAVRKNGTVAGTAAIQVNGTGGIFPAGPGNLMVSELHYNPPGPDDTTEFIELLNITGATLNLSGCHFDDNGQGLAFTFLSGTTIAPGGRILVVRDAAAFAAAYPGAGPVAGVFTGALDNSGEEIVLFSASGQEILRFNYDDSKGSTDGGGRSLVRAIGCTPLPAEYLWRPSTAAGGNPGTTDALTFSGDPLADADADGHSALVEYAFGTSDSVWNPATDFLTPAGALSPVQALPLPNADCARVEFQSSDDLTVWTSAGSPSRRYWRWKVTLR